MTHFRDISITILAVCMILGSFALLVIHIIALIFGVLHFNKKLNTVAVDELIGVSIIKPLVGVDSNLKSNLETFFTLNYPKYELLFSVVNENDPAILVVRSLIASYPCVDARLFVGSYTVGLNGKINNMMKPYENAKYNAILISDSSIRMEKDTLISMAVEMTDKVGLVVQMPFVTSRKGFAGTYEQVYFGTMQARIFLFINAIGGNCCTGMSCLYRQEILDRKGGLAVFGKYLAEDFFIAQCVLDAGYKISCCSKPALQNSGQYSVHQLNQRLIRWSQLRYAMLPSLIVLEPLVECIPLGAMTSFAVQWLFGFPALAYFLIHMLLWFLLDYVMFRVVHPGALTFSKFEFLVAWLLREFISPYLMLISHSRSSISWHNRTYHLKWGGVIADPVLSKASQLRTVVTM